MPEFGAALVASGLIANVLLGTKAWLAGLCGPEAGGWSLNAAYRVVFLVYAAAGVVKLLLVALLSPAVELEVSAAQYQPVNEFEL